MITLKIRGALKELLTHGWDVYLDSTNVQTGTAMYWALLGWQAGARVRIVDLTTIPMTQCIQNDWNRRLSGGRYVGESIIRGMGEEYLREARATIERLRTMDALVSTPDQWRH